MSRVSRFCRCEKDVKSERELCVIWRKRREAAMPVRYETALCDLPTPQLTERNFGYEAYRSSSSRHGKNSFNLTTPSIERPFRSIFCRFFQQGSYGATSVRIWSNRSCETPNEHSVSIVLLLSRGFLCQARVEADVETEKLRLLVRVDRVRPFCAAKPVGVL